MFRRVLLTTGALVLAMALAAFAQEFVVEVSAGGGDQADNLFSRVGKIKEDGSMDWGNKIKIGKGKGPSVAADGKTAVLVSRGAGNETKDDLFYRVGTVDLTAMTIAWGAEVNFSKGDRPSVSFKGIRVVEVHQSPDNERLWIMNGILEVQRQQITFGQAVKYDPDGSNPTIAVESIK